MRRSRREAPGKDARLKFQPGKDPLEKEESIAIIKPQNKQQRDAVIKMLTDVENKAKAQNDTTALQAIGMWKTQYEMNQLQDSVDYGFLKDWWYWLLGRASDKDAARTLWGRANVAAHNDEVAAYIELFVQKRLDYALKLISLANRVPDTINE